MLSCRASRINRDQSARGAEAIPDGRARSEARGRSFGKFPAPVFGNFLLFEFEDARASGPDGWESRVDSDQSPASGASGASRAADAVAGQLWEPGHVCVGAMGSNVVALRVSRPNYVVRGRSVLATVSHHRIPTTTVWPSAFLGRRGDSKNRQNLVSQFTFSLVEDRLFGLAATVPRQPRLFAQASGAELMLRYGFPLSVIVECPFCGGWLVPQEPEHEAVFLCSHGLCRCASLHTPFYVRQHASSSLPSTSVLTLHIVRDLTFLSLGTSAT